MNHKLWIFVWLLALLFVLPAQVWAQGSPYTGPDDPAGDDAAIREGYMDGNRIYLYYQNTTELAYWISGVTDPLWSRWPNNFEGERMIEGVGLLIGAKVYVVENDTIPVTNPVDIQNGYVMIDGQPRTYCTLILSANQLPGRNGYGTRWFSKLEFIPGLWLSQ